MFKKLLILLYTSKTLFYFWNFGRMLGMVLFFQILTGVFLVFYYCNERSLSFDSVQYIIYDVSGGWLLRIMHFNGASLFFLFIYAHVFKGLFFFRYRLRLVWGVGIFIFLLFIGVAFMGYVLVWAQIRFWASVVITRLLTVVPIWGISLVFWVWGGFSVGGGTLKFFFCLHFLLPWLGLLFVGLHLFFLHETGSTSSLFCFLDLDKVGFFPYFLVKDLLNILFFGFFVFLLLEFPFFLGDPEMFLESNFLVSPIHIVPEWYFLFAYAILRCVPDKMLGVMFMLGSILLFLVFRFFGYKFGGFDLINVYLVLRFIVLSFFLRWLGQCLMEYPYILLSSYVSEFYFFFILLLVVFYFLHFLFIYN
jgi:ubiquinol-cytochrome c reductase cytochrome b subunit